MTTRGHLAAVLLLWHLLRIVCGSCDVRIAVKSGEDVELTSPNYPLSFSNQIHCFYDLTTEFTAGYVLSVSVLDATLSCDDPDTTLEVFDAFSTSALHLGKVCAGGITQFVSPRERLYLVLKSRPGASNATTSRGFKLSVKSLPEFAHCYTDQALVLSVLLEPQHFISPYYPLQVAPNVHCRWLLKAPQGHRVHVDILHADMKGSDNCVNFGLSIYDGKTSYDDEKLASVCSNSSQSFCSTGNYLMVVFTSGAHVLHSGGGIKVGYYSSVAGTNHFIVSLYVSAGLCGHNLANAIHELDISGSKRSGDMICNKPCLVVLERADMRAGRSEGTRTEKADSSLLFILVGVLLGLATFTIVMVILRFIVIPARMQALARRYHPNTTTSTPGHNAMANDPPPPYEATDLASHGQKTCPLWRSLCCCCFLGDKTDMRRNSQNAGVSNDAAFDLRNGPFTPGQLATPQILSELTGNSVHIRPSFLQTGTSSTNVPETLQTGVTTNIPESSNEYQELPTPVGENDISCSEVADNVVNDIVDSRFRAGQATRYNRVDSGYQEGASDENGHGRSLAYINSSHVGTTNPDETADEIHTFSRNRQDSERQSNRSVSRAGSCSNDALYVMDDSGYEIPVSVHAYDSLTGVMEDEEDEGEGVYHKLQFDVQDA